MMIVSLESWEYEHGCNVGIRRFTANWSRPDAAHYQNKAMQEDNRTAQVASALLELAVAKHTNRFWSGHVWHWSDHQQFKHIPDVGRNIEVRRLRTRDSAAIRRYQNAIPDLIVCVGRMIYPELREAELLGWISQQEAWEIGTPSDYDADNTKLIHVDQLHKWEGV
jgi:hypothetical protein